MTYQQATISSCNHINKQSCRYGDTWFIPLSDFRGKRSNHSRLQRQSKHGALCRLQGQAAMPFPDKSSSRFAASVFIGKTLSDRPMQKKPLQTETTAPPPTDRKGK